MSKAGQKILAGLKDALEGNLSRVVIDGQTWVRQDANAGWQPIETAPKDGTPIWVSAPASVMRVAFWAHGQQFEYRGSIGGGWRDLFLAETRGRADLMFTPTLWQPLPAPPAEAKP